MIISFHQVKKQDSHRFELWICPRVGDRSELCMHFSKFYVFL